MKPSVYIETTIVSYIVAGPSRDLIVAAHQQITNEWWKNVRAKVDCFVSSFVIDEAGRGDRVLAPRRLALIRDFGLLDVNESIGEMAARYFAALNIPDRSRIDSFHLAVAAWHKMD